MGEPKNRLGGDLSSRLMRLTMLCRTSEIVGQAALANALGIEPRSLRAKLSADRGVSDDDLRVAAKALEMHAAATLRLATKISDHV